MWIVATGWIYVVILMAATETSVTAGIMTFLIYCMIPLSLLFYLTGSKRRRARQAARQAGSQQDAVPVTPVVAGASKAGCGGASHDGGCDGGGDGGGGGV